MNSLLIFTALEPGADTILVVRAGGMPRLSRSEHAPSNDLANSVGEITQLGNKKDMAVFTTGDRMDKRMDVFAGMVPTFLNSKLEATGLDYTT